MAANNQLVPLHEPLNKRYKLLTSVTEALMESRSNIIRRCQAHVQIRTDIVHAAGATEAEKDRLKAIGPGNNGRR